MTKLKTLKDYQKEADDIYSNLGDYKNYKIGDTIFANLKAEAIKWIKDFEREYNEVVKLCGVYEESNVPLAKKEVFMGFFNITEEDFK